MLKYISKMVIFRAVITLCACVIFFWYFGVYHLPNYILTPMYIDNCKITLRDGITITDEEADAIREFMYTIDRVTYDPLGPTEILLPPNIHTFYGNKHIDMHLSNGSIVSVRIGGYIGYYTQTDAITKVFAIMDKYDAW